MATGLYLGKEIDPSTGARGARLELDPSDLLTHGLIVGMTGSGKTGLAITLIEEVLRQGVPVLAIDPKGDLGNLLLLFDDLSPASFAAWVDGEAARREGKTREQAGADAAHAWQAGLADWGLSAADVASLHRSREAAIYTPGSRAGRTLNVLQSLAAPSVPFASAEEDLRDEIAGIVSGLLALVRIEADPLRSREFILLTTLVETAWRAGRGLTLEELIPAVADPPFDKVGALPLETVYPRKDRQALMMALNNLVASPGFEVWREGEPLDPERLLHAPDGRPRLAVVSTAHLGDEERLFVTALLLDKVKTWMRGQGGTTELRALVYMDEIFGYFPPHPANPPTKRPLLTLLKQARAQGVGVVLATQNPVDLDYKGLANMGTWLVGTLQTEQDRARLREGLVDAGGSGARVDALLDATKKRVFLLHDVHRKGPVLLESRWAMSYLRGPLTREEIARLDGGGSAEEARTPAAAPAAARPAPSGPPVPPEGLGQCFLARFGGQIADPYLLVKYAVRYKGAGETVATRAWPLAGRTAAEALDGEPRRGGRGRRGGGPGGRPALRRGAALRVRGRRARHRARAQGPPPRQARRHGVDGSPDQGGLPGGRGEGGLRRPPLVRRPGRGHRHPAREARRETEGPGRARAGPLGPPVGEVGGRGERRPLEHRPVHWARSGRSPEPPRCSRRTGWRTTRSRAWRRCAPRWPTSRPSSAPRHRSIRSGSSRARSCRRRPR